MSKHFYSLTVLVSTILSVLTLSACQPPKPVAKNAPLETTPLSNEIGQWKVTPSAGTRFIVTAPGASQVQVLYKPVTSTNRHAVLGTMTMADANGKFSLEWKPDAEFTGDVWAEATGPDGTKKKTNVMALAGEAAISLGGNIPLDSIGNSAETNKSAHSDNLTGGKITKTSLVIGDYRIWITVNVPAFRLTLWQNGKEVKTYQIGVGRLDFPLPVGERKGTEIVWNPDWIPPDSKWVTDVEPGEKIEADDPRNPLGKIKLRLGDAILIHEAASPSDIGRLASHGCVRMRTDDLFDLTEKIVAARRLPVTKEQIEQARTNTERLAVKLDPPLWVDINYDTQVVEGGVLHLYPDVYKRQKNDLVSLRNKLDGNGVAAADEIMLRQMLERVIRKQEFAVSLTDLKAGRALAVGRQVPLTNALEQKPDA